MLAYQQAWGKGDEINPAPVGVYIYNYAIYIYTNVCYIYTHVYLNWVLPKHSISG